MDPFVAYNILLRMKCTYLFQSRMVCKLFLNQSLRVAKRKSKCVIGYQNIDPASNESLINGDYYLYRLSKCTVRDPYQAGIGGNLDIIRLLRYTIRDTAIMLGACHAGNMKIIQRATIGELLNQCEYNNIIAAEHGHLQVLKYFNHIGCLHVRACFCGAGIGNTPDIIKYMVDNSMYTVTDIHSAFMNACEYAATDVVKCILSYGFATSKLIREGFKMFCKGSFDVNLLQALLSTGYLDINYALIAAHKHIGVQPYDEQMVLINYLRSLGANSFTMSFAAACRASLFIPATNLIRSQVVNLRDALHCALRYSRANLAVMILQHYVPTQEDFNLACSYSYECVEVMMLYGTFDLNEGTRYAVAAMQCYTVRYLGRVSYVCTLIGESILGCEVNIDFKHNTLMIRSSTVIVSKDVAIQCAAHEKQYHQLIY